MNTRDKVKINTLPGNSFSDRDEKKSKPQVKKIVNHKIMRKKKTVGQKISGVFFNDGDDKNDVKDHLIYDVLIPSVKETIFKMVKNGFEMLLFGGKSSYDRRSHSNYSGLSSNYVPYSNIYNSSVKSNRSRYNKNIFNFDEIIFESRREAEDVLSNLIDLTMDYGMASVADLYSMTGLPVEYTDNEYGWDELSDSKVIRVREGYIITFPKVRVLD